MPSMWRVILLTMTSNSTRLFRLIPVFLMLITMTSAAQASSSDRALNLVWISVEDMSPWLGCYGDSTVPTPNVDRLAEEGVRYVNAFATTPVCAPSRSTLITGQWTTELGSMHMRTGKPSGAALSRDPEAYADIPNYEAVPSPEVRCFPELLRAAGRFCTNRSKTDYQFKAPATTWDQTGGKAHWRKRSSGDQPFFAVFNLTVTHESGTFLKRARHSKVADPASVAVPPYYPDTPTVRDDIARTYDNIAVMDQQVGRILKELADAGVLENTVVMFFSDHGVGLPRGKRCIYDSGTRIPLIIRWPAAMKRLGVEDRVVSFVDFAPTALSICGVRPPAWMSGRAFAGDYATPGAGLAFIHADRMDAVLDRTRAVTDGRYRYVRNFMPERPRLYNVAYAENIPMMADIHALRASGDATTDQWQMVDQTKPEEEFYDTAADPHEIRNLITDPPHASRIAALRAALTAWMQDTSDLGLHSEGDMVRRQLWDGAPQKPTTAPPTLAIKVIDGRRHVVIECETEGASLGWRLESESTWHLVDGPIRLPDDATKIEALAHRIGYLPQTNTRSVTAIVE